jgi:hypothetical protein
MTDKMCPEPQGDEKAFLDSLNSHYKDQLTVSHVACHPGYIQVHLEQDLPEDAINSIECSCREYVWNEVLIYDKNGKLIRGSVATMQ